MSLLLMPRVITRCRDTKRKKSRLKCIVYKTNIKYYELLIRMRRKIIDGFSFKYVNDLFEIKLIILRSESYIATF